MPPPLEPWAIVKTREAYRARLRRWLILSTALLAIGNFLVLWYDGWLELLGAFVMMAAVTVAGYSPSWRIIHTDLVIEDKKPVDPRRAAR